MAEFYVVAIKIRQRVELAAEVQNLLTEFGCIIKMRLGLHEAGNACSNQGLILLEVTPEPAEIRRLTDRLNALDGVTAKTLEI